MLGQDENGSLEVKKWVTNDFFPEVKGDHMGEQNDAFRLLAWMKSQNAFKMAQDGAIGHQKGVKNRSKGVPFQQQCQTPSLL